MLIVNGVPPSSEGSAKFILTIGRTGRHVGFGSMKSFQSAEEVIEALRDVNFTNKALLAATVDLDAGLTHIAPSVQLTDADFMKLGMQPPQ